jgi:hypothetical protein
MKSTKQTRYYRIALFIAAIVVKILPALYDKSGLKQEQSCFLVYNKYKSCGYFCEIMVCEKMFLYDFYGTI